MATDFFRSERLVYRNIEAPSSKPDTSKSESSKSSGSGPDSKPAAAGSLEQVFHTLAWDASQINATPALWQPVWADLPRQLRAWCTSNMLISVYICLPADRNTPGAVPDPGNVGAMPAATAAVGGAGSDGASSGSGATSTPVDQWLLPVGTIHLSGPREPHVRFMHHRCGTIGINVAAAYQGKGYGGEALRWITDWGFKMAGLHRIKIQCAGWNKGAERLYQRIGFRLEGVEKEAEWFCGAWRDLLSMAMLEHEFWELDWVKDKNVRDNDDQVIEMLKCQ